MGQGMNVTTEFDPDLLDLPDEDERPTLNMMVAEQKAILISTADSWAVMQLLDDETVGLPFARGNMDDMEAIIHKALAMSHEAGITKCWIRGRPGWEKILKRHFTTKVHSVCYELTHKETMQ